MWKLQQVDHPEGRSPSRVWGVGRRATLIFAWTILALGCGTEGEREAATPHPLADAVTRPLAVVTLSPASTRFVIALGGRDLLVGVDPESSRLPGMEALSTANLETAWQLAPDLVLMPALPASAPPPELQSRADKIEYVEFAPHDLEEVFDLSRSLGERLVGRAQATLFEHEIARPLAQVGGASSARERPRIAGVVGLRPLELAGGHSFATDLIEIAGGTSVTHGGEESSFAVGEADWARLAPDLVVVLSSQPMSEEERSRARAILPAAYPLIFFSFDPDTFWLEEPANTARRLRKLLLESQGSDS